MLDPARALDRLDAWVERKLPPPRGPLANVAVLAVRLLVGRGSWVLGALLIATSAPLFVFLYRHVETMGLAAYYRATATVTAEARVERTGLRLVPGAPDSGLRGEPYVVLAFEPETGETVRLRYLPHGEGLEPFQQVWLDAALFHSPPEYARGWRLRWAGPDAASPAIEVRTAETDLAAVAAPAFWNLQPEIDNALAQLDRPLDWLMGEWLRPADDDRTVVVRFRPGEPRRVFAGDALDRLPPTQGSPWGDLFGSAVLLLPFGLPFWWFGTRLLAQPLPPRWRHVLFWGPLALLPLWGDRYVEVVERLTPGQGVNPTVYKMVSHQVLPGSEPLESLRGPAQVLDLTTSRFSPVLARVDLRRPERLPGGADAVWRELGARFTTATAGLPDAELEATLGQAFGDYQTGNSIGIAPVLIETARRATLDPARSAETREAAARALVAILEMHWPPLCEPAFAARWDEILPLAEHPNADVAAEARAAIDRTLASTPHRDAEGRPRCSP